MFCKKLRLFRLLILTVLAVIAAGCGRHGAVWSEIDLAESLMDEHPDSAQKILEQLYPYTQLSDEDRARCGVLLATARLRQNESVASDELLDESIKFYKHTKDSVELFKTYQLKSYQTSWRSQQDSAAYYLNKALALALIASDNAELLYSMNMKLSDLYSAPASVKDYAKAIAYAQKSLDYAIRDEQRAYACNQIGACYGFMNENDSASKYLERAVVLTPKDQPSYITYVLNYTNTPDVDFPKAERLLRSISSNSLGAVITLGYLNLNNRNIDGAKLYAWQADSIYLSNPERYSINTYNSLRALKSCVAFGAGKPISVTEGVSRNDSISMAGLMNEARRQEITNNNLLLQNYSQRQQLKSQRIIGAIIAAGLFAVIVFFLYDRRNKKRYIELRKELDRSRIEQIDLQSSDAGPAEDELIRLWRKRADLCRDNFASTGWLKKIQALESAQTAQPEYLPQTDRTKLRRALFEEYTDVIVDIKASGDGINLDDISLCLLSLLKLGNRTISQCMGVSENAIRTRKSRLKDKLSQEMYMFVFDK